MQPFDPGTVPLTGQRLIEASAGTGKTFSIALVFLRMLLERKLHVDQILVVTYTTSATAELRDRIRARLYEAYAVLESSGTGPITVGDELLQSLLQQLPDRVEARQRLLAALARMDESAIFTIHGFCQRMLRDHAFESGAVFTQELLESEFELRQEIIRDFWRQTFYGVSAEEAQWAQQTFENPDHFARQLKSLLARPELILVPDLTGENIHDNRQRIESDWKDICHCWRREGSLIREILTNDPCLRRVKKKYKLGEGLEEIFAWMDEAAGHGRVPWKLPRQGELMAASVLGDDKNLKGKKIPPSHDFFDLMDRFRSRLDTARFLVMEEAFRFLQEELAARKQKRSQIFFQDLLSGMARALDGQGGTHLTRRIRDRFAVALVDEFQDTDSLQYTIFQRLFGHGSGQGLFMIGDPKQAIYSFRGADVFAYIRARQETSENSRYTMDTNYRSTTGMVRAVNYLFDREGSFVFSRDIPFSPVCAKGNADTRPLQIDGEPLRPLQAMILDVETWATPGQDAMAKEGAAAGAAELTARQISRLLRLGVTGRAQIGERSLAGGDIAVLVRSHWEADLVQRQLSQLRIPSVYYSQDSVFSTIEAWEVQQLLDALLDLSDVSRVRAALVTTMFGWDAGALEGLQDNTTGWDRVMEMLFVYQQVWHSQGVAAMLQRVLYEQEVVQRLVGAPFGERKLTNFLHLGELLQAATEKESGGDDSLVHWLRARRSEPEENAEQQLRLESDENLVRIVTIHKAKGLEYPVVFLPFAWRGKGRKTDTIRFFHRRQQENQAGTYDHFADLGSGNGDNSRQADREELAENRRLLYVSLTRACHCCYLAWGRVKDMDSAPLTPLLHGTGMEMKDLSEEGIQDDLAALQVKGLLEFVPGLRRGVSEEFPQVEQDTGKLLPKEFAGQVDTSWSISSYSRMVRGAAHVTRRGEVEMDQPEPPGTGPASNVFAFPRGPGPGTCLHDILERVDFAGCSKSELTMIVEEQLQNHGIDPEWCPVVVSWMKDVLASPLPPDSGFCLQSLSRGDWLVELEFYFAMEGFRQKELNRVLAASGFQPVAMIESELKGLMRGFIDLVFCHGGRYFLCDYKSNHLGSRGSDYRPEHIARAMTDHRYDLQYLIYSVALHRYLRDRMREYDFSTHFGGVYYLFLRGMGPDEAGRGVYFTQPSRDLVEELDKCFGRTGVEP